MPSWLRAQQLTRRDFISKILAGALLVPRWPAFALPEVPQFPFQEIPPEKSGIRWVHSNGKSPEKYLPETTGAGCAFLDYDNDGWMDIYLVNSGKCDFFTPNTPLRNALYKNNRDGTFTDVTEKAGVAAGGYGQGVAVGDYDGDGFPDVYVTQYGRLDLVVGRFVEFSKELNKPCGIHEDGRLHYCIPKVYSPMSSWLFHNNGDGTFTDVSKESGISSHLGKVWGVVATDINNDGLMDLWVSNDTVPNFLFVNRGKGRFDEIATTAGVAYSDSGRARSGMGVDSADFDNDGSMGLYVANLDREMFAIYKNNHDETFDDLALSTGIGKATKFMSGWGLKFFDYDNDGNLDLFLANGNPDDLI